MRCHLANFSVSLFVASAKQVTGPSQKKKPNMPLMWPPQTCKGCGKAHLVVDTIINAVFLV